MIGSAFDAHISNVAYSLAPLSPESRGTCFKTKEDGLNAVIFSWVDPRLFEARAGLLAMKIRRCELLREPEGLDAFLREAAPTKLGDPLSYRVSPIRSSDPKISLFRAQNSLLSISGKFTIDR